jgi:23S rRNA (uracil1939-C5)-methyltransferase
LGQTVKIQKLVFNGYGLGHLDGQAIFVPNTLPGDEVDIVVTHRKQRHLFGKVLTYHRHSPFRQNATCSHFPNCGGCQLIDVDYAAQVQLKTELLTDILRGHPEWQAACQPVVPALSPSGYRNKMEFAFFQTDGQADLGLRKRHHFDQMVSVTQCHIQHPDANMLVNWVRNYFRQHPLPVWDMTTQKGLLRYLVLRYSKKENAFLINIIVSRDVQVDLTPFAESVTATFTDVRGVVMGIQPTDGDTAHAGHIVPLVGRPFLIEAIGTVNYRVSPTAFFQANSYDVKTLYDTILRLADLRPTDTVLDLYCGSGTVSLYAAPHVREVVGIEFNPAGIADAIANAVLNGTENVSFLEGPVRRILKNTPIAADVVITDPPRAGMEPKSIMRMAETGARTLIYVSCNPTAMVRDLDLLNHYGYQVETLVPIDMFPQTFHMEVVVRLTTAK